jgi:hypothetical protein
MERVDSWRLGTDALRYLTVATVLGIGAENGCLKFATGVKEEAEFNDGRILLVRNWYGGFLVELWAFIFWCVAVSKSNPSWGQR